jgi:hypothetical protein
MADAAAAPRPVLTNSPVVPALAATPLKPIDLVPITPPPEAERVRRGARFAEPGEKRSRYTLPESLVSSSPVGFRTRVSLDPDEANTLLQVASLPAPTAFVPAEPITEQRLFEEASLSVLLARQSTNFRGFRDVIVGGDDADRIAVLLRRLRPGAASAVLDGASHCHVVLSRPYRTPFTMLLTFVGHKPLLSLATVPLRALQKRFAHVDDIPTIGILQQLHLGILGDCFERGVVVASGGRARAAVHMAPLRPSDPDSSAALRELETVVGLTDEERRQGYHVALVAQVGDVAATDLHMSEERRQRLGAALLALRSERIQPGVNNEATAPAPYLKRQQMDVPDVLTEQCGRALYNAFAHFAGVSRDDAKALVMLERVDVLTPNGKERLRAIRSELEDIADKIVRGLPLWADLPMGKALSKNTARGKKAFALAGQRIYIGGLSRSEVKARGLDFDHATRAFGAAGARAALVAEIAGSTQIPEGCDLLAGVCLMAGPVNQNDIGKSFFGYKDLLSHAYPDRDPTSLLVWTLKAKTVADPIGNEEQLMNPKKKGVLVDLRPGPHDVVFIKAGARREPMRQRDGRTNQERAFWAANNFVTDDAGRGIPGNVGVAWPKAWANAVVFAARTS